MPAEHLFHSVAFRENFALKELAAAYPGAQRAGHELRVAVGGGTLFLYSFGAATFEDVEPELRQAELARLHTVLRKLSPTGVDEDFVVKTDERSVARVDAGVLTIDRLTEQRAGVVALVVAQSAAMEYYETLVEKMFLSTDRLVDGLERSGTTSFRVRALHRFIGHTVGTRNEVLSVLHLLDKPDATWDDAQMDRIYDELREQFDLQDRYQALEAKLRGVQEALELVLDVARDRRLYTIELAVVLLILCEIVLSLVRH